MRHSKQNTHDIAAALCSLSAMNQQAKYNIYNSHAYATKCVTRNRVIIFVTKVTYIKQTKNYKEENALYVRVAQRYHG
jgi:hypothetical protein